MSELRKDPVSKDWIIMAPERAGRPRFLARKKKPRRAAPKRTCPFEDLKASGNWPPIMSFPNNESWRVAVIPNKFPALVHHQACTVLVRRGPYELTEGIGHHDLVITRDHNRNFTDLTSREALELLVMFQKRYRILAADRCLLYTSTFFNWGASAGASIYHPHYQVLTLPIIPPDVEYSLRGSKAYWQKTGKCVHCAMLAYERKMRTRVICEDRHFISIAPFVSRQAFEIRVFPKRHLPYFEKTPATNLPSCVHILQATLRRIRKNLRDPDFNFFIHTSPLKRQDQYGHYHWHIEILPTITIPGGFELSSGVEITVVAPEEAARILRG